MRKSTDAMSIMERDILEGRKIAHSTSQLLIHREDGKYYLAAFVFFYNREDVESGMVKRPSIWALADIESGEIIKRYDCSRKDFSNASHEQRYDVRPDGKYDLSDKYYYESYAILDEIREELISNNSLDMEKYKLYLSRTIANIPKSYQRFYTDLSI